MMFAFIYFLIKSLRELLNRLGVIKTKYLFYFIKNIEVQFVEKLKIQSPLYDMVGEVFLGRRTLLETVRDVIMIDPTIHLRPVLAGDRDR